jgi:para-aminobenzoate synthetase component 1
MANQIPPHILFSKIEQRPYSFFLDSAINKSKISGTSFMGSDPFLVFKSKKDFVTLEWDNGKIEYIKGNPFIVLKDLLKRFKSRPGGASGPTGRPPDLRSGRIGDRSGGAVGYFGYDMKDFIERLPDIAKDDIGIPDCIVGFYDKITVYDKQTDFPVPSWPARAEKFRMEDIPGLKSNFSKEDYVKAVKKAKEYIKKGDIYQVNLSQRFESQLNMEPYELYLRLRDFSPAPFSSYLNFGDCTIISSSPERFLMKKDAYIETRPIKGTRPRSCDPLMDEFNEKELTKSYKDRAEHIMIVDLERNDLGRICEYGSVKPTEFISLEKYSTVFHLVSTISGRLKKDIDAIDCLVATFPGGSITGAPKIRSMEIIEELEPVKRSIYTGAIGYISFDGNMDTSIVIRTILIKNKKLYFQVGGGIVYDSDPEKEYLETLDKAMGIMQAIGAGISCELGVGSR